MAPEQVLKQRLKVRKVLVAHAYVLVSILREMGQQGSRERAFFTEILFQYCVVKDVKCLKVSLKPFFVSCPRSVSMVS
jgi:hypothetical protein